MLICILLAHHQADASVREMLVRSKLSCGALLMQGALCLRPTLMTRARR